MVEEKAIRIWDRILEVCLCALIFFLPFSKGGVEGWLHSGLLAWLIKRFLIGKRTYKSSRRFKDFFKSFRLTPTGLNKPIYVLAVVSFTSAIFGVHIGLCFEGIFGKLFTYFFVFYLTLEVLTRYDPRKPKEVEIHSKVLRRVLGILLFSIVLIVIDGLFQLAVGKDFMRGFALLRGHRLRASFGNTNDFAGWIIAVLPVLASFIFIDIPKIKGSLRPVIRFSVPLAAILAIYLLGRTFSRGAWLGYFASLVFVAVTGLKGFGRKTRSFAALGIILLAGCLFAVFFFQPVRERAFTLREGFNKAGYKKYNWREAIAIIEDFPVLGTGPNTYATVGPYYKLRRGGGIYPHNSYLHMTAETGLLGIAAFLWIVWRFFYSGIRSVRKSDSPLLFGILAGLLAFLVQSFFDTNLYTLQLAVLFWFLLGLGTSLSFISEDR